MNTLISSAIALAAEQPVLPLEPAGKRPLGGLGLRQATRDAETVARWWATWPDANIGMRADSLLVVDVDGEAGEKSLLGLQHLYGQLPASRAQATGRGRHLFYATEVELGNSTNPLGRPDGIDLRAGTRGYVVAAPSLHPSGRRYTWVDERPPAPLPPSWVERLLCKRAIAQEIQASHVLGLDQETAYGVAALEGEMERLLRAREGEHNEVLNAIVFRLAQLVAGNQLPLARVEHEAFEAAFLLDLEPVETRQTIASAVRAGLRFPRFPSRARARAKVREVNRSSQRHQPLTFESCRS
jgi:hypothetical protein